MKKMLVFAAAAMAALLVSCSKKSETSESAPAEGAEQEVAKSGGGATIRLFSIKVEIDATLKQFAADYEKRTGTKVEIESSGGGADNAAVLKAYKASDNMPDIFVFSGPGDFKQWRGSVEPLDNEPWVKDTTQAYKDDDGHIYGFPYAVEGYGMAYNAEILEKAGVDPKGLTSYSAYKAAFEKIDAQKADLGLDSVVSMACGVSAAMTWVTAAHNIGVYLSAGLPTGDTHVIDEFLQGKVDRPRLEDYGRYVKLIFDYSDKNILLNGNYDQQMQAFIDQKTAFLHQGNWADPTLEAAGATFKMAFAPHAFTDKVVVDGLQVSAPSWWAVYNEGNVAEAKKFLIDLASSPEGRKARIETMKLISPFLSDTLVPSTQLSASVAEYVAAGKTYPWEQVKMPDGFGDVIGPIYELLANGTIDEPKFCDMMEAAIGTVKG